MSEYLLSLANAHPQLASLFLVIGFLRFVLKPLFVAWHNWAHKNLTPEQLAAVERFQSKLWVKILLFLLDYIASIKINKQPKQK
jgi:hypothetical protein